MRTKGKKSHTWTFIGNTNSTTGSSERALAPSITTDPFSTGTILLLILSIKHKSNHTGQAYWNKFIADITVRENNVSCIISEFVSHRYCVYEIFRPSAVEGALANSVDATWQAANQAVLSITHGVATCLENLEMSGNLEHVREMSGMLLTVREMSGKKSCHGKVSQYCSLLDEY